MIEHVLTFHTYIFGIALSQSASFLFIALPYWRSNIRQNKKVKEFSKVKLRNKEKVGLWEVRKKGKNSVWNIESNPPFFSCWIITSVIAASSVTMKQPSALPTLANQFSDQGQASPGFLLFSRRTMPNYICEYQRSEMTRGHRPKVSSEYRAPSEHMAIFLEDVFN